MKKLAIIAIAALCLAGCHSAQNETTSRLYTVSGWYYTCGEVITEDGNTWGYDANGFENEQVVLVVFDDMGTPDNIYDDEIIGLIK